jgi:CHAT domain-containing protein
MDRVVSSYTPTVRALRYARQHGRAAAAADRLLVVAMPTTPGLAEGGRLAHVVEETEKVAQRFHDPVVLMEPDPAFTGCSSGVPTRAAVLAQLRVCGIAHFACHGASNPVDPSKSLLVLHDHEQDPLTVAGLAASSLDQAQLAYLSACRTAAVDTGELIDEAIHLTSAFQLTGFPHVVGTLWEIDDRISVDVADGFYARLTDEGGRIDIERAAGALHGAVRAVRDRIPAVPSLWAAYLHAGA